MFVYIFSLFSLIFILIKNYLPFYKQFDLLGILVGSNSGRAVFLSNVWLSSLKFKLRKIRKFTNGLSTQSKTAYFGLNRVHKRSTKAHFFYRGFRLQQIRFWERLKLLAHRTNFALVQLFTLGNKNPPASTHIYNNNKKLSTRDNHILFRPIQIANGNNFSHTFLLR